MVTFSHKMPSHSKLETPILPAEHPSYNWRTKTCCIHNCKFLSTFFFSRSATTTFILREITICSPLFSHFKRNQLWNTHFCVCNISEKNYISYMNLRQQIFAVRHFHWTRIVVVLSCYSYFPYNFIWTISFLRTHIHTQKYKNL